jgi:uncharacterized protein YbgA (DUF1722 family)/uncharacterized protein YbbK (DUF523 family)
MTDKIRIGISSCLLGLKVRYDGGHKYDPLLVCTLGEFVEYVPVCPEVEAGFPIPREAFRLVGPSNAPRLVTQKTGSDVTERMKQWADHRLKELEAEELCGFIFKSKSPSSGMERVKVYNDRGMAEKTGVGIFARAFMDRFPWIPVEEDGRLQDIVLRENFIVRIFAYRRWKEWMAGEPSVSRLVEFHSRHKLLLMAHSPAIARALGERVAGGRTTTPARLYEDYLRQFQDALTFKATVKKNTNVLMHMMGYFKKQLSADEKQELLRAIENYRLEFVPLVVPLVLIQHYVRKYGQMYLKKQYYLDPHPLELKLRNHA